jgi:hypothetical protein
MGVISHIYAQAPNDTVNGWVPHFISSGLDSANSELSNDAYKGMSQHFYMRTRDLSGVMYWEKNFGTHEMPYSIGVFLAARGVYPAGVGFKSSARCEIYVGYPDSSYAYLGYKLLWTHQPPQVFDETRYNTLRIPQKPFDKILFKVFMYMAASETSWCYFLADNLSITYGTRTTTDSIVVLDTFGPDPPAKAVFVKNIDTTFELKPAHIGQIRNVAIKPTLTIQNKGDDTLRIKVRTNNIHYLLTPFTKLILPGGIWTWSDSLAFSPKAMGYVYEPLIFEHNGASSPDTVVLWGFGYSSLPIYSKKEIVLGNVAPGATKKDTFSIRNIGTYDLFLKIKSLNSSLVVTPESTSVFASFYDPDSIRTITVRFTAGLTPGAQKTYLVITDIDKDWRLPFSDTIVVYADIITGLEESNDIQPKVFALHQNYPNPFNPTTTIRYDLPYAAHVTLTAYDILGKEVWLKDEGFLPPGTYGTHLDASRLSSGIYFYRIRAGEWTSIRRMMLLK